SRSRWDCSGICRRWALLCSSQGLDWKAVLSHSRARRGFHHQLIETLYQNPGSFRDPFGYVHELNGVILRTVTERARKVYEAVRATGVMEDLWSSGYLIKSIELPRSQWPNVLPEVAYVLTHPKIPFVSYPYEWCFAGLKSAALHHVDLQIRLMACGLTL